MSVSNATFQAVRDRALYACEYCGVREADSRALLTVDHIQPESRGGDSDLVNLAYACFRCNLYKSAYWPKHPTDVPLWNPRVEPRNFHMIEMLDGRMMALTDVGRITIGKLRLNRKQAVMGRVNVQKENDRKTVLRRLSDAITMFAQINNDQEVLTKEHHEFLQQQLRLLRVIDEPRDI